VPPQIVEVGPPAGGVYRVGRKDRPVLAATAPDLSGKGRFDDPWLSHPPGIERETCFGVVYCATSLTAAFAETLQGFRVSLSLIADLLEAGLGEDTIAHEMLRDVVRQGASGPRGVVGRDWMIRRHWGRQHLLSSLRFADICASQTLNRLRSDPGLAALALDAGIDDIDLSAVTGRHRSFTQACARFIHSASTADGNRFAGIRYLSRLGGQTDWECWALFDDRITPDLGITPQPVAPDTPALQEACRILGIDIEDM
jgi:hypothetical protein